MYSKETQINGAAKNAIVIPDRSEIKLNTSPKNPKYEPR
jgi:hypothetical protein